MAERLVAALSPNGTRVHLADKAGRAVCGSRAFAGHHVRARVTCAGCRKRRPKKARRLDERPLVVGLNWEPYYRELGRAMAGEITQAEFERLAFSRPRAGGVRVPYWPVLGEKESVR